MPYKRGEGEDRRGGIRKGRKGGRKEGGEGSVLDMKSWLLVPTPLGHTPMLPG